MRIRGADNLTPAELAAALAAGGRFVFFEYCISVVVLTLRCPTDVFFLRPGESAVLRGLPYTLLSLSLGWWGIPMGIIYTPLTLVTNLTGGCDVTDEVRALLGGERKQDSGAPADGPAE
jgi:hypothetical protein